MSDEHEHVRQNIVATFSPESYARDRKANGVDRLPSEDDRNPDDGFIPHAGDIVSGSAETESASVRPIRLLAYADMVRLPPVDWLIDFVLPRRAKSVLFGQSDSFKSFIAIDMACSVATGRTFHGNSVRRCKVIYVANEGANGVGRKRIPAWMAAYDVPPEDRTNIFLVNTETILPDKNSRQNLLLAIRNVVEPGEDFFLIIDVLRGSMAGSEKDDEAADAWTKAAEVLIAEGATLLTVTHSPYGEDGRMRGHSHLWGSFDTRLHAEGDKERRSTLLKVNRHKDHDSSGQWGFKLDEVAIPEHPGEQSLVPRLDGNVEPKTNKAKALPKGAKIALDALHYAIGECGAAPPTNNHIPASVKKVVTVDQWTNYALRKGISTSDKPDARRKALDRASERLIGDKLVAVWDDFVWPVFDKQQ